MSTMMVTCLTHPNLSDQALYRRAARAPGVSEGPRLRGHLLACEGELYLRLSEFRFIFFNEVSSFFLFRSSSLTSSARFSSAFATRTMTARSSRTSWRLSAMFVFSTFFILLSYREEHSFSSDDHPPHLLASALLPEHLPCSELPSGLREHGQREERERWREGTVFSL